MALTTPDEIGSERSAELVTTTDRLLEHLHLHEGEPRYGLDTEFANQKTSFPRLALIQIAWPDTVNLIDPFTVDCTQLRSLFDGPGIAIIHSAQNDLEVLDHSLGMKPSKLFDTQVAALLLNYEGLSLQHLTSTLLGIDLDKGQQNQDWTRRPLSDRALKYAAEDVLHLFALMDLLSEALAAKGRVMALDEECEFLLAAPSSRLEPDRAWWRLSGRETIPPTARLFAAHLARTREELAEQLDLPKRKLLRDEHLIALATNPPTSLGALRSKLSRSGVEDRDVTLFWEAVQAANRGEEPHLIASERSGDRDDLRPIIAKLQVAVTAIATEQEINQGFLASRRDLVARLNGQPSKFDAAWRQALVTEPIDQIISAWRAATPATDTELNNQAPD